MKTRITRYIKIIFNFSPVTRKLGAACIALITKIRGGKELSFVMEYRQSQVQLQRQQQYQVWLHNNYPSAQELVEQKDKAKSFEFQPKISILVPTYNTDIEHLGKCIESVIAQTYFNWELCIADDASPNKEVEETLRRYSEIDDRVKYVIREENGHICAATNTAIEISTGDYLSLLDHDDILWPNALFEVVNVLQEHREAELIYTDEDKLEMDGTTHTDPFFKPDWSPDYLRTINYITHFSTLKRELMESIGGFRMGTHGAQDWDLFLRATEETDYSNIVHIPKVVYSWRKSATSTAMAPEAKDYAYINQKEVLEHDLTNRGYTGEVHKTQYQGYWRVQYNITDKPLVSIIIPTKESYTYISRCLNAVFSKSTYDNFEVVVVDTGSENQKVKELYEEYRQRDNFKVVDWKGDTFNFSAACNKGAQSASGDYYLFLNNDTEVITEDWIESLLEHAQRPEAGAVGCKLLFEDLTIQHGGIVLGMSSEKSIRGVAGHLFSAWADNSTDHMKALFTDSVRNYSAVTAACMMVEKSKFEAIKGFDEKFKIAFNDVDLCLRLQKKGYFNVYTPFAKLYHYESKSVGKYKSKQRSPEEFKKETSYMGERWTWKFIKNDPYYNPHLALTIPYGTIRNNND